jgi:hypothetical protein
MGYTAIVLDEASRERLLDSSCVTTVGRSDGSLFDYVGHHMTVNMGRHSIGPMADVPLGTVVDLTVTRIGGIPNRVLAVTVKGNFKSKNETPHITCGVNRAIGARPVESNDITNWLKVPEIELQGRLEEVG